MAGELKYADDGLVSKDHYRIPNENYAESITPIFRYENILNRLKSEDAGRPVYDLVEVVEVRFAGDTKHVPVRLASDVYRTVNGRAITFAERFSEQYQRFINGDAQKAHGTPLEELQPYGITPAQISICRALNIHTIEALDQVEGDGRKKLGVHGNELKPMAKRWMDARAMAQADKSREEVEALKARIAELEAVKPADPYDGVADDDLKERIAAKTGSRPKGNPNRATLVSMARDLEVA